jgi:hypothetical protein
MPTAQAKIGRFSETRAITELDGFRKTRRGQSLHNRIDWRLTSIQMNE